MLRQKIMALRMKMHFRSRQQEVLKIEKTKTGWRKLRELWFRKERQNIHLSFQNKFQIQQSTLGFFFLDTIPPILTSHSSDSASGIAFQCAGGSPVYPFWPTPPHWEMSHALRTPSSVPATRTSLALLKACFLVKTPKFHILLVCLLKMCFHGKKKRPTGKQFGRH